MAAQKMKNKIPARLYIYFHDGEISKYIYTTYTTRHYEFKNILTTSPPDFTILCLVVNSVYNHPQIETSKFTKKLI